MVKVAVIPSDSWKKNRDRISRRVMRGLHLVEVNPGPMVARLRYDYMMTRAEIILMVEEVMRETERLAVWHIEQASSPIRRQP